MVTKKKTITKKKIPVKEKIEPVKPVEEYKPIFDTIVLKSYVRRDANYYGIKQILRKFGLDLFKKLKPEKEEKQKLIKPYKKNSLNDYYQEMNLIILSIWFRYCKLWEMYINGKR